MKIMLTVASTTASGKTVSGGLKVSAPRRVKIRHGGSAEWKKQQRDAKLYYKRNKNKIKRKADLYKKRNATRLAKRAEFLKHAPKARIVAPTAATSRTKSGK